MINFFKNKLLTIPAFIFFLTVYGVIVLSAYANQHKIPLYDLISSQALIAIGGASFVLIILSCLYLAMAILGTVYSSGLLLKNNFSDSLDWKVLYLVYSSILTIGFFVFTLEMDELYAPSIITLISFIPLAIINNKYKKENSILFLIKFIIFSMTILFFNSFGGFIFLLINNISETPQYNVFLSIVLFSSLIFIVPSLIKENKFKNNNIMKTENVNDENKTRRELESRIIYFSAVFLVVMLILPLKTNISDNTIKFLGIGYEERCYYSDDLKEHKIPKELIEIKNNISKIFVLSDVSNKIYISGFDGVHFSYSFNYGNLNRISCF